MNTLEKKAGRQAIKDMKEEGLETLVLSPDYTEVEEFERTGIQ